MLERCIDLAAARGGTIVSDRIRGISDFIGSEFNLLDSEAILLDEAEVPPKNGTNLCVRFPVNEGA